MMHGVGADFEVPLPTFSRRSEEVRGVRRVGRMVRGAGSGRAANRANLDAWCRTGSNSTRKDGPRGVAAED